MNNIFKLDIIESKLSADIEFTIISLGYKYTVDSYYLAMGYDGSLRGKDVTRFQLEELFRYWLLRLQSSDQVVFLPIDFSDEYISGLFVEKHKEGHVTITERYTRDITGFDIDFKNLSAVLIPVAELVPDPRVGSFNTSIRDLSAAINDIIIEIQTPKIVRCV